MADLVATQFPKSPDKERLARYKKFDQLYAGNHFSAFNIEAPKEFNERYARLRYVAVNFAGLVSRIMADMLFGEPLTVTAEDENNQKYLTGLIEQTGLFTQLSESALANSRRGDDVFKLRTGRPNINGNEDIQLLIEQVGAELYFPSFDLGNARYTPSEDVLIWKFNQLDVAGREKTYLHREGHRPGFITHEIFEYDEKTEKVVAQMNASDFGFADLEETGVERSLVFHIPNFRDGTGFWGTSDYQDLMSLFFAINNRITKVGNILDKHSDPVLAVPPGVLDEKGKINRKDLGVFEVRNDNPGFNKPEYIVWDANLEAAFNEIDKLVEMIAMISEASPTALGIDKEGMAESGRALKFRLLSTIRKFKRKKQYYDKAITDMLQTALELGKAQGIAIDGVAAGASERPTVKWPDGIINDEVEDNEIVDMRLANGTMTEADALMRLDGITKEEADTKAKELQKAQEMKLPTLGKTGAPFLKDKPIPTVKE